MKAAIYVRVSTDQQERQGTSLETQLDGCLAYCHEKGYEVAYRFREDYTGLALERPELDKLRAVVRAQEVDLVIVYCLDRYVRDPVHGVILQDELERYGVRLESVTEDVDDSDLGRLIAYIKGYAAKLEAQKIKERTTRGKRARAEKQGLMPCGRVLYGYDYDPETGRNIANDNLRIVRMVGLWLVEEGVSLNECRRRLQSMAVPAPRGGRLWGRGTLARLLRNPAFCGRTVAFRTERQGKKRVPVAPERQVEIPNAVDKTAFSFEEWSAIQRQLDRNKEMSPRNRKHEYLLHGLISCGECGSRLFGVPSHGVRLYRCSGKSSLSGKNCHSHAINAEWIETSVWDEVAAQLRNPDFLLHELQAEQDSAVPIERLEDQIKANLKQLRALDDVETRYVRLYGAGLVAEDKLKSELVRLKTQEDILRKENDALERQIHEGMETTMNLDKVRQMCKEAAANIESFDPKQKRLVLEALSIQIVAGERIRLRGKLPATDGEVVSLTSPCCALRPPLSPVPVLHVPGP